MLVSIDELAKQANCSNVHSLFKQTISFSSFNFSVDNFNESLYMTGLKEPALIFLSIKQEIGTHLLS